MRICLYAGAGAGKSTVAKRLCGELSARGYDIDLIPEYIKKWAYEKKTPRSFDQLYVFGKQVNAEDSLLQSGVEHLVTDSPIFMQVFYAKKYDFPCWEDLLNIADTFDAIYPSYNIFLDREGIPYRSNGRYENESQARENDAQMKAFMDEYVPDYTILQSIDLPGIVEAVDFVLQG